MAAYDWLRRQAGPSPQHFLVLGDSAGGGLALGLLLKLRDSGIPLPAAAVVISPWTDLALTGSSLRTRSSSEPMLNTGDLEIFTTDYLAGTDPRNPYASPLYGDPAGLPPTLFQVGSDEILFDDAARMAEKMKRAGCQVDLSVWKCMPHVWHLLAPILPEATQAIDEIKTFTERIALDAHSRS